MGQLETLAETQYANAAIEACEAIGKLTYAAESGEDLHSEDLARVAVTQFVCGWWQQVMDVVNSEDADGAEAITRIRQEAERRLLMGSPALYGDLFAQAMLQAGRQAAQQFLATTQPLVDVLAGPATTNGRVNSARTEPGTCSSQPPAASCPPPTIRQRRLP